MIYHQLTIQVSDRFRNALIGRLIALGSLGVVEQDSSMVAYFPGSKPLQGIIQELDIIQSLIDRSGEGRSFTVQHDILQDADWNESWKKAFKPINVGTRFTVLPPWEQLVGDRTPLIIEPGMAFGTGHHQTTRSCLVLMEQLSTSVKNERFLDVGTGTGLLAIAARILGFKQVVGVDTDLLAMEAARKNIGLNRLEGIELHEGDISCTAGTYDMIAANLISGTLVELAGEIASRLKSSGVVIMSGILKGQDNEVADAAGKAGLRCVKRLPDEKWVTLAFRH
jgi:ribosomal protein L11 methyltransferase